MAKNFTIITNAYFEDERLLMERDTILLIGDRYHDNIVEKIEGFIQGVRYCGYTVNVEEKFTTMQEFVVQIEE